MIKAVLAGIGKAGVAIAAKVLTQSFYEELVSRAIIWLLWKLAKSTRNTTVDDELAASIEKRLLG